MPYKKLSIITQKKINKKLTYIFLITTWLLGALIPGFAEESIHNHSKPTSIPHLTGDITLDGKLNEKMWQQAKKFDLNLVTLPYENTASPVTTKAYIFDGGETLYIGFEAQDPNMSAIRANLRDRDKVWQDDLVGIILDTYGTNKLAYHFYVNPLGVQIDSVESEVNTSESDDWDALWQSKTSLHENGFSAEFAIPMSSLHFNNVAGNKQWALELLRWYPREVKYRLSHIKVDRNNGCSLCQKQRIEGFSQAQKSQHIEFNPSIVVSNNQTRNVFGNNNGPNQNRQHDNWQSDTNTEIGADINWHISSDDLLSATFNPDFSQVEVDEAQVAINNDFSLFFPEKRPFFLSNQSYFDSFYSLLHTRNIGAPDFGAKYTSRKNQHTFAALIANDEGTSLTIPGNLGSITTRLDESSTNAALRYRYDYGNDSSIGVTSTLRESDNYHNYLIGFDGNYRFNSTTAIRWHLLGSDTQYPGYLAQQLCNNCSNEAKVRADSTDNLTDLAWQIDLSHNTRNWWVYAKHVHNGEDIRADLGFENKVDYAFSILQGGVVSYEPRFIWNRQELRFTWSKDTNIDNEKLRDNLEMQVNLRGNYQSNISAGIGTQSHVGVRFDGTTTKIDGNTPEFDLNFSFLFFEFRPISDIYFSTLIRKGDAVDFANNRKAKQLLWKPIIEWDVSKNMELKMIYTWENMDAEHDDLYVVRLTDLRTNYQFSNASKLRLSLIYNNSSFNDENYISPISQKFRSLGGQLIYSYRFNALSSFFLGITSNAIENDQLGRLVQNEKNVFTKLTLHY